MENHYLQLEEKNRLTVTEVISVEGFDDNLMVVNLQNEELLVSGRDLGIELLDLEEGRLIAAGQIESLVYNKKKQRKKMLERFRK